MGAWVLGFGLDFGFGYPVTSSRAAGKHINNNLFPSCQQASHIPQTPGPNKLQPTMAAQVLSFPLSQF